MTSKALSDPLEDTLAIFTAGGEPWTTPEVAEQFDIGRRTAYARLERLVDRSRLQTKKVGASARVWWRPQRGVAENTAEGGGRSATGKADDGTRKEFERLVEAVDEYAIFTLDADGYIQTWNPGVERIKGYEADEVLGEHFSLFYTEDAEEANVPSKNLSMAATQGVVEDEGWRVRKDGTKFWANVTITAIRDDDGNLDGYAKVTRDMTDRHEYEQQLHKQREYIEQTLEAAPVGVVIVEPDGTFETINELAADLLEVDQNATGTNKVGVTAVYDADGDLILPEQRPYIRVFETGESVRDWYGQVERSDGSRRWVSTNIEPMTDESGGVERAIVTIQDVSQLKAQAEQLERQRDELRSELDEIFERITDGFYALDEERRFTYINDRAAEALELDQSVIGQYLLDEVSVTEQFEHALIEAQESQEPVIFEEYDTQVDRWFSTAIYPSESGLSVYFRDITDRKEREQELNRFEVLTEQSRDVNVILAVDGTYQYVSPSMANEFGHDPDALLGENAVDYIHPEDRERVLGKFAAMVENPSREPTMEYRFERADGSWAVIESRARNLLDSPDIEGIVVYSRDITERKERERALRETKTKLEAATTAGQIGTWNWDVQDDRLVAGNWLADVSGIDPEAAIQGVPLETLISRVHEDDRDRVDASINDALSRCGDYETEYRVRDTDNEIRWVVARGQVECTEKGDPVALTGVIVDITERKRAELELERQRQQLAALNNLNDIVRTVTDAVISQSTREEIEQTVCAELAAADVYEFAWVGDVDSTTQTVNLRAEAGVDGYLDGITISVDPDDERSQGPTGQAFRTGEIQTIQNSTIDPRHDPWRDHLESYEIRSSAAIPIVHEGTTYGVLNVYATRPYAFEGRERDVISRLGEIIGHAIAATERKRALLSDEVVELEFQIPDVFPVFGLESTTADRIQIDHAVPRGEDEYLVYGTTTTDGIEVIEELTHVVPHWESVRARSTDDPVPFEVRLTDPPVLSEVGALGGYLERFVIEDGDCQMVIHLAPSVDVRRVMETVEEAYPQAEMLRRTQISRPADAAGHIPQLLIANLTDRQQAALDVAYHSGYFNWPRERDGTEIAESLGISPSTLSYHLRKAQQKIYDTLYSSHTQSQN